MAEAHRESGSEPLGRVTCLESPRGLERPSRSATSLRSWWFLVLPAHVGHESVAGLLETNFWTARWPKCKVRITLGRFGRWRKNQPSGPVQGCELVGTKGHPFGVPDPKLGNAQWIAKGGLYGSPSKRHLGFVPSTLKPL